MIRLDLPATDGVATTSSVQIERVEVSRYRVIQSAALAASCSYYPAHAVERGTDFCRL
jgi:hypothetical protein